jgi:hypothetical protein
MAVPGGVAPRPVKSDGAEFSGSGIQRTDIRIGEDKFGVQALC